MKSDYKSITENFKKYIGESLLINNDELKQLNGLTIKSIDYDGDLKILFTNGKKFRAFVMDQGDTALTMEIE